jgi:hypothetical protein
MPHFPKRFALFGGREPLKSARLVVLREPLHRFRLFVHAACAVAVKFKEQNWRHGIVGLRVAIARIDLRFIHQLDASHGHA